MKKIALGILAMVALSTPAYSQIKTAVASDTTQKYFDRANACLQAFDAKAKVKKLSAELYKTALEGSCVEEISNLRAFYDLSLERSPNQKYHVERLDKNIEDARAAMVTSYVMR